MDRTREQALANMRAVLAEVLHDAWPGLSVGDCVRIADAVVADLAAGNSDVRDIVTTFFREQRTRSHRGANP